MQFSQEVSELPWMGPVINVIFWQGCHHEKSCIYNYCGLFCSTFHTANTHRLNGEMNRQRNVSKQVKEENLIK